MDLSDRVALVTGSGRGIGRAIALKLAEVGATVVVNDINGMAQGVADEIRATGQQSLAVLADVSSSEDVTRLVETAVSTFGKVDILVNCAGAARAGAFPELSDQDFMDVWTLKLLGYIRMVREAAPHMIHRKDGRIVNIFGAAGRTPPPTFLPGSTANE